MKFPRRRFLQLTASVTALHALTHVAQADDYPSRPIRLIVGFTPGTATDIAARTLANGAEGLLGQKMVVENRPGAGSGLAAAYVGCCAGRESAIEPAQRLRADCARKVEARRGPVRQRGGRQLAALRSGTVCPASRNQSDTRALSGESRGRE